MPEPKRLTFLLSQVISIAAMDIGVPELLIILVVVLLLFGPGRISKTAGELGKGIRSFREGLNSKDEPKEEPPATPQAEQPKDQSQTR